MIDRKDVREHLEKTKKRYWYKGEKVNVPELADQIIKFLHAQGVPVKDSDWS